MRTALAGAPSAACAAPAKMTKNASNDDSRRCGKGPPQDLRRVLHTPCRARDPYSRTTFRPLSGCTGRLLAKPTAFVKAPTCAADAVTGVRITSQVTPSEHGGVVSEPAKR